MTLDVPKTLNHETKNKPLPVENSCRMAKLVKKKYNMEQIKNRKRGDI